MNTGWSVGFAEEVVTNDTEIGEAHGVVTTLSPGQPRREEI
jgi:non-canonical (house-cleaning) NTP pyrophosphatase